MSTEPVEQIISSLYLVMNIRGGDKGGFLLIDKYTFDPNLRRGDSIYIEDFKLPITTATSLSNKSFSFSATVLSIEKIVKRH